jgi:hypothetical protein
VLRAKLGDVNRLDLYPTPERFDVAFNAELGKYEATPAEGPWADGSIPGAEAMLAWGDSPGEAIDNARVVIEHLKQHPEVVEPPASYADLAGDLIVDADD